MSTIRVKYCKKILNQGELLDGSLGTDVLCWEETCVTVQTHVPKTFVQAAVNNGIVGGFYLTDHPQITPAPPKLDMYQVTVVCKRYSPNSSSYELRRLSGEPAYNG
jgi:hypothetical protein